MLQQSDDGCDGEARDEVQDLGDARLRLVGLTAEARAQHLLRDWAAKQVGDASEPLVLRALRGGPWEPGIVDSAASQLATELLAQAGALDAARAPFIWSALWALPEECAMARARARSHFHCGSVGAQLRRRWLPLRVC